MTAQSTFDRLKDTREYMIFEVMFDYYDLDIEEQVALTIYMNCKADDLADGRKQIIDAVIAEYNDVTIVGVWRMEGDENDIFN